MTRTGRFCTLGLALLTGCATPSLERIPLSEKKQADLAATARTVEELGVTVQVDADGHAVLGNVRNVPLGISRTLPLNVRPFRDARFPIVRMHLNGRLVLGLVDSGSSSSLIDYRAGRRAKLSPVLFTNLSPDGDPMSTLLRRESRSPGGDVHQITAVARTATFGDLSMYNVPFGVVDDERGLRALWWLDGYHVEAVIGFDVLAAFDHFTLNFGKETLHMGSGRYRPEPRRLVAALPLTVRFGVPVVEAYIGEAGPLHIVLDTGADFGLWVPETMARDLALPGFSEEITLKQGDSIGGPTLFTESGHHNVNIGGFTLSAVPTVVGRLPPDRVEPPYALLGNRALNKYSTTFDYKAGKVYFETP